MIVTFMIALCALAIALYVQARMAAREIRRHREMSDMPPGQHMVMKHRVELAKKRSQRP